MLCAKFEEDKVKMAKDLKKSGSVLVNGISAMKNFRFYHSCASSFHPFLKGVAFCLAGFIFLPSLAATPLSDAGTPMASSVKKGKMLKKRSPHPQSSHTGKNDSAKETAALNWEKRLPFSPANPATTEKKTVRAKAAALHASSVPGGKLSFKPGITDLPVIAGTDPHPFRRTSSVFRKPGENNLHDPGKTVSFNTDTAEIAAASDRTDGNDKGYAIGPARFIFNYEKTSDRSGEKMAQFLSGNVAPDIAGNDLVESRSDRDNWHIGMEYAAGNGRVNAAVNYVHMKDGKNANAGNDNSPAAADLKTFTIGYTYDVSEKTSFYGMVARTEYEREAMAGYLRGSGFDEDNVTGFQLGVTHRF